jgi:hypothetical protein
MNNEITILNSESLERVTRAEVDIAITTAKKFPRELAECRQMVLSLATTSKETAESCFYALPRGGKSISGYSVRLAEIIANSWGNLNCGTRVVGNDGKVVTAQAVVHDLQRNVRIQTEVKRKITDKHGKTFTEDMQVVTGNAACAIALRNAIFKVVPEALLKEELAEIKKTAIGKALDLETRRENVVKYFSKLGVSEKQLLELVGKKSIKDIDNEILFELKGLKTALEEGSTTIDETFNTQKNHPEMKVKSKEADKEPEKEEKPKDKPTPQQEKEVVSESKPSPPKEEKQKELGVEFSEAYIKRDEELKAMSLADIVKESFEVIPPPYNPEEAVKASGGKQTNKKYRLMILAFEFKGEEGLRAYMEDVLEINVQNMFFTVSDESQGVVDNNEPVEDPKETNTPETDNNYNIAVPELEERDKASIQKLSAEIRSAGIKPVDIDRILILGELGETYEDEQSLLKDGTKVEIDQVLNEIYEKKNK